MQINNLQNTGSIQSLDLTTQQQNAPKRNVDNRPAPYDKISQFVIILSGGIAWGTIIAGFNGACIGVSLSLIVSYFVMRK